MSNRNRVVRSSGEPDVSISHRSSNPRLAAANLNKTILLRQVYSVLGRKSVNKCFKIKGITEIHIYLENWKTRDF